MISVCKGNQKGDECTNTNQCDRGLYCDEGRCKETGEGCNAKGEGCSVNQICIKATKECVKLASIENDKPAPVPAACKSYYQNEEGKCTEGPKLKDLHKHDCPKEGTCQYSVGDKTIETSCSCAKDNTGKRYCPPGKGDINTNDVILILNH
jgi:hypothetical protein